MNPALSMDSWANIYSREHVEFNWVVMSGIKELNVPFLLTLTAEALLLETYF